MINYLCLLGALILFSSCTSDSKSTAEKENPPKKDSILTNQVVETVPDSILVQIHELIDSTPEYQSVLKASKAKGKNKTPELMVFGDQIYPNYEVNVGQTIFDRFSTSLRWNINLISKEIKMRDPNRDYEEVTLAEFRKRYKKYGYNSYL